MIKSKKGTLASFLMENFGLIIGAIVVIGLFVLAATLYNALVGSTQGTEESFNDLVELVNRGSLVDGEPIERPYFIERSFVLAGFNSDGNTIKYSPAKRNPAELKRPDVSACENSACLCICEGLEHDACVNNMVKCQKAENVERFVATQSNANLCSFGLEYHSGYYLYFAGEQKTWGDRLSGFFGGFIGKGPAHTCLFGIRTLKIEKEGQDIKITIKD